MTSIDRSREPAGREWAGRDTGPVVRGRPAYEEIAGQAGVSQATVYRHFPSLAALIPACAAGIPVLERATPALAAELFAGLATPLARITRLVEGTCDCYERDGAWLSVARREDLLHPALEALGALAVENLRFLVHVALEGTGVTRDLERTVVALIDYPFWNSLQAAGFTPVQARRRVMALVRTQIGNTATEGGHER